MAFLFKFEPTALMMLFIYYSKDQIGFFAIFIFFVNSSN